MTTKERLPLTLVNGSLTTKELLFLKQELEKEKSAKSNPTPAEVLKWLNQNDNDLTLAFGLEIWIESQR